MALIGMLVYLLFIADGDMINRRSWKELWNLGHIPLFAFVGYITFRLKSDLQRKNLFSQVVLLSGIGCLVGGGIEGLQLLVGRQASLNDIALDLTGVLLAVPLFSVKFHSLSIYKRIPVYLCTIVFLVGAIWKFSTVVLDELYAYKHFPVMSGFEHQRELSRWTGNARRELSNEVVYEGSLSLKVNLLNRHYSGVELEYFPRDWSNYSWLQFQVFNAYKTPFSLIVSVFDSQHKVNRFRFHDRFTGKFVMKPGWNEVRVPLTGVKQAPRKRQMDMTDIQGLRLYLVKPQTGHYFFLDDVRLIE